MTFVTVVPSGTRVKDRIGCLVLVRDNWNDWFRYVTMFTAILFDDAGRAFDLGSVKIGQFEMKQGQVGPDLPENLTYWTTDSSRWVRRICIMKS